MDVGTDCSLCNENAARVGGAFCMDCSGKLYDWLRAVLPTFLMTEPAIRSAMPQGPQGPPGTPGSIPIDLLMGFAQRLEDIERALVTHPDHIKAIVQEMKEMLEDLQ